MKYVDGFVIPVPKKNVKAYLRMARWGKKMWLKNGALDYMECMGDDLKTKFGMPFTRLAKTKPGETVFFSFIVYKSKAHRKQVNAKVMKEMGEPPKEMPFNINRMSFGGFKALVVA